MSFQKNHRDFRTKEGLESMGRKISKIRKGIKLSDKTKEKIRQANIGKKCSDETKKKMSKAHKGQIPINNVAGWNKGKSMSEEWRTNLSKSHKGKRLGKDNTAWKGGVVNQNNSDRKCVDFRLWREKVFKRNKYTCRRCKQIGGKLCSHHIYNFSDNIKLRYVVDNGITLCEGCHKEFHKRYGIKNNNLRQIEEFIK